jgi:hypothetical protein
MAEERGMTSDLSRLTVERVHTLSGRQRLLVTGRLIGVPLRPGDEITIGDGDRAATRTVVRSVEMHSAPGTVTIALDAALASSVSAGTVITRP